MPMWMSPRFAQTIGEVGYPRRPDFLNPFGASRIGRSVTQIETDSILDFKATVSREHQRIWRYLVYLGCDEHRAADLTQETFFRLLDREFEYRGEAATGAWLRRTAGNLFRKELSRPVAAELDVADAVWEAGLGGERDEYLLALDHCLQKLKLEDIDIRVIVDEKRLSLTQ